MMADRRIADDDGPCIWNFAGVRYDERTLEIERNGSLVQLERKPNELLRYLLRHANSIVTKDELFDRVWPGRIVTEGVLTKHVARLRRAIGDESQSIIRSVSGVGYGLSADVVRKEAPARSMPSQGMAEGQSPPLRPQWRVQQCLGRNAGIEVWSATHAETAESRVFKIGSGDEALASLKREITVSRLLHDSLPGTDVHVPLLDWNIEHIPFWIEMPFLPDGSLVDLWQAESGQWSLKRRMALMAGIADGVAAAHSIGVLHKDLKPANVLVARDQGGTPSPRLSDFGSARLLEVERLRDLGITRLGYTQQVSDWDDSGGTPLYLAPEVIRGGPFTLASDAFAFGVMLYQMAIDDLLQPIAAGWERNIEDPVLRGDIAALVEGDPLLRSTDLAMVARNLRALDARRQGRERDARVLADAEHARLSAQRARQRRNIAFGFAGILLVALGITSAFYFRAESALQRVQAEAARADRHAARAGAINDFLLRDLLVSNNPFQGGNPDELVRDVFTRAADSASGRFTDDPDTEASVRQVLAGVFLALSQHDQAEAQARQVLALVPDGPTSTPEQRDQRLDAQTVLAHIYEEQGRRDDARALLGDPARWTPGPTSSDAELRAAGMSAHIEERLANHAAALVLYDALLPELRRRHGHNHNDVLVVMRSRGDALHGAGRTEEALAAYREVHQRQRALHGDDDLRTANALRSIASVETQTGRSADALPKMQQVESVMAAQLDPKHLRVLMARADLAVIHQDLKQYEAAERLMTASLVDARETLDPSHDHTLTVLSNLALLYRDMKRPDDALAVSRQALDAHLAKYGSDAYATLLTEHNQAGILQDLGRWREAEAQQRSLVPKFETLVVDDHWHLAIMRASWAKSMLQLDRIDEGRTLLERAVPILRKELGDAHDITRQYVGLLAGLDAGKDDGAETRK